MRLLRGLEAGREALRRHRSWEGEELPPQLREGLIRVFGKPIGPQAAVECILKDVRARGDAALRDYTRRIDNLELERFEVPRTQWLSIARQAPRRLRRALADAAQRVRAFHQTSLPKSWFDPLRGYGERFTPLDMVGVYIPGGAAPYPSTVLMTAIPARVAGVSEVILASPGRRDGMPDPSVLAAAELAGVDRVFCLGGAQAIAALAYGTETVPRVDMVCGPGNIFVTLAKRMVYGEVALDGLYGPTETVVIADGSADPRLCAADLLAQAEHDPLASPIFITTSETLWHRVQRELDRQLQRLSRREVATQALQAQGIAVLVDSLEEAVELANLYAPEHLCLLVAEPWQLLGRVRHAGGVFLGSLSPEAMGDYVAGPSHVMPTGGTARFSSPLGVHQFLKVTSVVSLGSQEFSGLEKTALTLAKVEGFSGHAQAIRARGPRRRRKSG